jgi:surface antigen
LATLALASVGSGGCSMSYQLGSLFGKNDEKVASAAPDRIEATGSTRASPMALRSEGGSISEADMAAARRAAADMLAAGGKDTSAPWQNPDTGARGMVTPITAAYTQDGLTCRDFLASVVRDRAETWLQGEACRVHRGKWEVRTLKPWKRA